MSKKYLTDEEELEYFNSEKFKQDVKNIRNNKMENKNIFTNNQYDYLLGKSKQEVLKLLKGKDYRITREDNTHYIITMDFRIDRWNLAFDNNILTEIKNG